MYGEIASYIIQFYSGIHGRVNPGEMAGFPGAAPEY